MFTIYGYFIINKNVNKSINKYIKLYLIKYKYRLADYATHGEPVATVAVVVKADID